jgi:hypothetical protein
MNGPIISVAYCTPAVSDEALALGLFKTCTRRDWSPSHADMMCRHVGQPVQLWNYCPRVQGAHYLRSVKLLSVSEQSEEMILMPDSDFTAEGFEYLARVPGGIIPLTRAFYGAKEAAKLPAQISGPVARELAWELFQSWQEHGEPRYVVRWARPELTGGAICPSAMPE